MEDDYDIRYMWTGGGGESLPIRIVRAESAGDPLNWFICMAGGIGRVSHRLSVSNK